MKKINATDKLFICLVLMHIVLWTVVNTISRHTVNGDTIEAFNWGSTLSFGYDKNPYMPGFIAYLAMLLSKSAPSAWGYYLIQQSFIGIGLWGLYTLGKNIVGKEKAMISVLIMEGCFYFNAYVQSNNDNYILIGLIPWSVLFFYRITLNESKSPTDWLLLGLFASLATMTKYSYVIVLLSMGIYLILSPRTLKQCLQQKTNVFLLLVTYVACCLPNLIWLIHHQFITIQYLAVRLTELYKIDFMARHLYEPLHFIWDTGLNLSLPVILFCITRPYRVTSALPHKKFILCIGALPIVIVILCYLLSGSQSYWEWGVPFVLYLGMILIDWFDVKCKPYWLFKIVVAMLILGALLNIILNKMFPGGSADFPAHDIAKYAQKLWTSHSSAPFNYVGGSRYLAGYIAYYGQSHPKVYPEWNSLYASGITDCNIHQHGAIFVQSGAYGTFVQPLTADYFNKSDFPKQIYQRFPTLQILGKHTFYYYNGSHDKVNVLFGIVRPNRNITCANHT